MLISRQRSIRPQPVTCNMQREVTTMSDTTAAPLTPSRMRSILTLMMGEPRRCSTPPSWASASYAPSAVGDAPHLFPRRCAWASALCGLMGTIVTQASPVAAARRRRPSRRPARWAAMPRPAGRSLRPPSRARSKLGALGRLLGVDGWRARRASAPSDTDAPTPEPTPSLPPADDHRPH